MVMTRSRSKAEAQRKAQESNKKGSQVEETSKTVDSAEQYEAELRAARKRLTLFKRPVPTLKHFFIVLARFLTQMSLYLMNHSVTKFLVLPMVAAWVVATYVEGPHHEYLDRFNVIVELVTWWVGLGVLSSVGLGTGMHSGILFLFPHIFFVVQGAQECKSLSFDSWHHVWFRSFQTACQATTEVDSVTFWAIFQKVFLPCMLWGAGTAIGEIPPYAISRAAQLAGQRDAEFEDITEANSSFDILNRMKLWMIKFLQTHGFFGVFLMSAWPNMAFDLCGICCGHFLMPFWTFFGATLLGKAVVKANLQAIFFITIFTDAHLRQIEKFVGKITPERWELDEKVNEFLLDCRHRFHSAREQAQDEYGSGSSSAISQLGSGVMILFILFFAKSCIEQFAQQHAAEEDAEKVENRKKYR